MRLRTLVVLLAPCLLAGISPCRAGEQEAVAALEKIGRLTRDETQPGKPVVEVNFTAQTGPRPVTDADLAYLKEFKSLKVLYLGYTDITDAGLAHLKGLTSLEKLSIAETKVTDAGLAHLKGLTNLTNLGLPFNKGITDKGLAHLTGLKKLEYLNVASTRVTPKGIAALQKALPKVYITR